VSTGPEPPPAARGAPSLSGAAFAALLGVALSAALFYPGLMSVDSAVQLAQARGALPLDDIHPPLMTWLWRLCDRLLPGPGLIFLLFAATWWGALAALLWQSRAAAPARWLACFAVGLWPATLLMLGHVWKDVAMAATLLAASAAILAWRRRGRRGAALAGFLLLLLASGLRHNAVAAALPLLAWLLWPRPGLPRDRVGRGLLALAALLALLSTPALLLRASGAARVQPWSVVLQWDLAALSIAADEVLLPPGQYRADLGVEDLQRAYVPWANPPLFDLGKLRLSFYQPLSPDEQRALLQAWWRGLQREPGAYLRHRATLARYLLLGYPAALPQELVYVAGRFVLPGASPDAPPVDVGAPQWRLFAALRPSPLFAGASYLLLAALAAGLALRRGVAPTRQRGAVLALAASAWGNALPLLLISGAAEFRYLTWSALAALAAVALLALGAGRRIG
jgi:hypothetical protein